VRTGRLHAIQREIARAIRGSASWVNRLLKWRRSGYKQSSPFGPTTRPGRAARRKADNNDLRRGRGFDSLLFGAAARGSSRETSSSGVRNDGSENGGGSQIDRCSTLYQPSPLSPSGRETFPSLTTQIGLPPSEIAAEEIEGSKTITIERPNCERESSSNRPLEQQKRASENPRAGQNVRWSEY
jgi:hypothetical protein